jgi:5S rRNA maturation endonuclease (ribonuclease M5)
MLRGITRPGQVVIVEGEPDFLSWCMRTEDPVIGIGSGWWTQDFADRVPERAEVILRTHDDEAGERYAARVAETLGERAIVWRAA